MEKKETTVIKEDTGAVKDKVIFAYVVVCRESGHTEIKNFSDVDQTELKGISSMTNAAIYDNIDSLSRDLLIERNRAATYQATYSAVDKYFSDAAEKASKARQELLKPVTLDSKKE